MQSDDDKLAQAKEIMRTIDMLHTRVVAGFSEDPPILALTPRQLTLLIEVRNNDGASIKDLAETLGVTASSMSTMVDRLVEAEILTREPNPADRRAVIVRVSPAAEKVIEPLERQVLRTLVELVEELGPEAALTWRTLQVRIREILQKKK